ncbi:MAG: hypothetical protein ACLR4Z_08505 [Butyricicoccaceae bacterium]
MRALPGAAAARRMARTDGGEPLRRRNSRAGCFCHTRPRDLRAGAGINVYLIVAAPCAISKCRSLSRKERRSPTRGEDIVRKVAEYHCAGP